MSIQGEEKIDKYNISYDWKVFGQKESTQYLHSCGNS